MTAIEKPAASLIPKAALAEFKAIYKAEYGEDISDEEALELATNLLGLFKCIYRPLSRHSSANKRKIYTRATQ